MRTTVHNSAQLRCFENGNDDFGVEAFWIGDAARVGYFVPLNGPLNGHPPSLILYIHNRFYITPNLSLDEQRGQGGDNGDCGQVQELTEEDEGS